MNKLKPKYLSNIYSILNTCLSKPTQALPSFWTRQLYTPSSLSINAFVASRSNFANAVTDQDAFKNKLHEALEVNNNLILTDDMKMLIKIAKTDDDLALLRRMMKKLVSQNEVIRFQTFTFGPEIMRLYYVLGKDEEALSVFEDSELFPLFNQVTSFVVLMDMLFNKKLYDKVIQAFDVIIDKQISQKRYPAQVITLFFGACYKLNTPESYEKAVTFWQKLADIDFKFGYRTVWFFVMLAFNQNHPVVAIEIISSKYQDPVLNSIKLMALTREKRYQDVLLGLKMYLYSDRPTHIQKFVVEETVIFLNEQFREAGEEHQKTLAKLTEELYVHNFIKKESLDNVLCEPMEYKIKKVAPAEETKNRNFRRQFN